MLNVSPTPVTDTAPFPGPKPVMVTRGTVSSVLEEDPPAAYRPTADIIAIAMTAIITSMLRFRMPVWFIGLVVSMFLARVDRMVVNDKFDIHRKS